MEKVKVLICIVLCMASIVAGCSRPFKTPTVIPKTAEFKGIDTLLKESKAVSLITIHGMCHHDEDWLEGNRDRFAKTLKMAGEGAPLIPVYKDNPFDVEAFRVDLTRDDEILRIYGIIYSKATLPAKQEELCRDVSEQTDVCPKPDQTLTYAHRRAWLNEKLKNELMNNCFADAVAYLGPAGRNIRLGVREALEAILSDARSNIKLGTGPVVILSESLGSKVIADALLCENADNLIHIISDLSRISNVFLGANQIPLLNLGFKAGTCDVQPTYDNLKSLKIPQNYLQKRKTGVAGFIDLIKTARSMKEFRNKVPESFSVVAFTDPNDLLSYEASEQDFGEKAIINVIVSNDATYLGILENPLKAHLGYRENESVINFLKCGRSRDGKLACE